MAAKLKWKDHDLNLGAFNLAMVERENGRLWKMLLLPVGGMSEAEKQRYESEADCRRDCESEVRRLLKEAGVEVMP